MSRDPSRRPTDPARPGEAPAQAVEVRLSESGRLSVSIEDVARTPAFKRDLDILRRLRSLHARSTARR